MLKQKCLLHTGKANDVYSTDDDSLLIIDHSDRISAGNGEKTGVIPGKGEANNKVSNFAFTLLEKAGIPTHFVGEYSNTATVIKKADMILLEVILRNEAAGSLVRRYGFEEGTPIIPAGLEYSLKNDSKGDPFIYEWAITQFGIATKEELELIEGYVRKANEVLIKFFDSLGLKLVDFKLEFGRLNGIVLCDEISQDTCRLVDKATGKILDKDRFRNDLGGVEEAYAELLKRL